MRYINDIGSTMKADYEKFPELPPGCLFNHNKKTGATQVTVWAKTALPAARKNVNRWATSATAYSRPASSG